MNVTLNSRVNIEPATSTPTLSAEGGMEASLAHLQAVEIADDLYNGLFADKASQPVVIARAKNKKAPV